MIKKELLIGFLSGLVANSIGTITYILIFSKLSIVESLKAAHEHGKLGALLALGAILNLPLFFAFLKFGKDYKARGVLIATLVSAFLILLYKLF